MNNNYDEYRKARLKIESMRVELDKLKWDLNWILKDSTHYIFTSASFSLDALTVILGELEEAAELQNEIEAEEDIE